MILKGGLGLAIEGPSKAEIQCRDNRDGTATIIYTPVAAGEYRIVIKFAGQLIVGAPYVAKITPPRKFFSMCTFVPCVLLYVYDMYHY